MKGSSFIAKLHEVDCTLLCVPFHREDREWCKLIFLGSKKLSLLIENIMSTFSEDCQLYRNEIYLEVLLKNLEPILNSDIVCLSIFGGGVVRYVYLVCLSMCLCGFRIFLCVNLQFTDITFFQHARKQM
jgi:hypothetical protein